MRSIGNGSPVGHRLAAGLVIGMRPQSRLSQQKANWVKSVSDRWQFINYSSACSIAKSARFMSLLVYFRRHISKTDEPVFTKSSRKMANGCNRKVTLLFSELFPGWEEGSKSVLLQRTSQLDRALWNPAWWQKGWKRKLSDFCLIISLPNAENAGKSVKGRPRSFDVGLFVPISDPGALLNITEFISFTRRHYFIIHLSRKKANSYGLVGQWRIQDGHTWCKSKHGGARLTTLPGWNNIKHLAYLWLPLT